MNIKFSKKKLDDIAEKYDLRFILLYGSFARGESTEGSDFDIAVYVRRKLDLREISKMRFELFDAVASKNKRDVDLVIIDDKDPLLTHQIMRDSQLLYGNKHSYNSFQVFAMRNFLFHKKIYDLEDVLIERALKNI